MLPKIIQYEKTNTVRLIKNSGIQFMDFGLKLDFDSQDADRQKYWSEHGRGCFRKTTLTPDKKSEIAEESDEGRKSFSWRRLVRDPSEPSMYCDSSDITVHIDDYETAKVEESLRCFDGEWLPLPFFRKITRDKAEDRKNSISDNEFDKGPGNWARFRIVKLTDPDDIRKSGYTHLLTIAFDTRIFDSSGVNYSSGIPIAEDIRNGYSFALACNSCDNDWYLQPGEWVDSWIRYVYESCRLRSSDPKVSKKVNIDFDIKNGQYEKDYLNLLAIIHEETVIPDVTIVENEQGGDHIDVNFILDIGNSRTCGIMIEDHPDDATGFSQHYELELRDLTRLERVCRKPFASRIEFHKAAFGNEMYSFKSGVRTFLWPTMVRIGPEAAWLSCKTTGNEGISGLSSPKRYLWDDSPSEQEWKFNRGGELCEEKAAVCQPMSDLINGNGEPLFALSDEDKEVVFHPYYSKRSCMTFMLTEIITQAICQMNSPAQRWNMTNRDIPRVLRSIVLTVPPSMPKQEIDAYRGCVRKAAGLVWQCMGWIPDDDFEIDFSTEESRNKYWPALPDVVIQWDEAVCGQVVYLYNEIVQNYKSDPDLFIGSLSRPDSPDHTAVTVATVDIGGGTTDLVINRYRLDRGAGVDGANLRSNSAYLVAEQIFHDGFRVAGDDIMQTIIQVCIIGSVQQDLRSRGISQDRVGYILKKLFGGTDLGQQDMTKRSQFNAQVFVPIALRILSDFEMYSPSDPDTEARIDGMTFRDILSEKGGQLPDPKVLQYADADPVLREELRDESYSILNTPLSVSFAYLFGEFIRTDNSSIFNKILKIFDIFCEVIDSSNCDVVLVTGRSSKLPGVRAFFNANLSLPAARIVSMYHYHTGDWYPFNDVGYIEDPKTSAAIGAMLCYLSSTVSVRGFPFTSKSIETYSTIKFFGSLTGEDVIKHDSIFYSNVNLDDPDYQLETETENGSHDSYFIIRGKEEVLGYKQFDIDRWPAAPLYRLTFSNRIAEKMGDKNRVAVKMALKRRLKPNAQKRDAELFDADAEAFEIDFNENRPEILTASEDSVRMNIDRSDITLSLNTMYTQGAGSSCEYWLDSGKVL